MNSLLCLMARSKRQKKKNVEKKGPYKTVTLLFMFDRKAVQVCLRENSFLRGHVQTRTAVVSWFLFFCHSILSQGSHTIPSQQKHNSKVTNWVHSLVWPSMPEFTLQRVTSRHMAKKWTCLFATVVRCRSVLLLRSSQSTVHRKLSSEVSERVTLPKLCN